MPPLATKNVILFKKIDRVKIKDLGGGSRILDRRVHVYDKCTGSTLFIVMDCRLQSMIIKIGIPVHLFLTCVPSHPKFYSYIGIYLL